LEAVSLLPPVMVNLTASHESIEFVETTLTDSHLSTGFADCGAHFKALDLSRVFEYALTTSGDLISLTGAYGLAFSIGDFCIDFALATTTTTSTATTTEASKTTTEATSSATPTTTEAAETTTTSTTTTTTTTTTNPTPTDAPGQSATANTFAPMQEQGSIPGHGFSPELLHKYYVKGYLHNPTVGVERHDTKNRIDHPIFLLCRMTSLTYICVNGP
jgi:hypothetical protein